MRRWPGLMGAVLLGGGLYGVSSEDSHHNACNSGLGQFGQALNANIARHCGVYNAIFYVGIIAAIVGLILMVSAILVRS
ncbi:MAG: hypothetical protein ACRD6W_18200 [Nitrososphaerales archaeon]